MYWGLLYVQPIACSKIVYEDEALMYDFEYSKQFVLRKLFERERERERERVLAHEHFSAKGQYNFGMNIFQRGWVNQTISSRRNTHLQNDLFDGIVDKKLLAQVDKHLTIIKNFDSSGDGDFDEWKRNGRFCQG
ncbi:hypothetical protein T4D_3858 [Trichinella pseudospiralis]|uniref:Uncharacterized protein n=1 Tax=Trichinella pseudospiralis TaxID=6337 RepID=A0A0V1FLE5_TRIPS|nr:hypothetical protein T4D_3858 [Trichinella pseudospiralis]